MGTQKLGPGYISRQNFTESGTALTGSRVLDLLDTHNDHFEVAQSLRRDPRLLGAVQYILGELWFRKAHHIE